MRRVRTLLRAQGCGHSLCLLCNAATEAAGRITWEANSLQSSQRTGLLVPTHAVPNREALSVLSSSYPEATPQIKEPRMRECGHSQPLSQLTAHMLAAADDSGALTMTYPMSLMLPSPQAVQAVLHSCVLNCSSRPSWLRPPPDGCPAQ